MIIEDFLDCNRLFGLEIGWMYEKEEESESDMGREIWNLLRPRFVIVFLIGSVLVYLAFSSFSQQVISCIDTCLMELN